MDGKRFTVREELSSDIELKGWTATVSIGPSSIVDAANLKLEPVCRRSGLRNNFEYGSGFS